jgi:hypothetical protein
MTVDNIDGVGGLLNDGITRLRGESDIRFGSQATGVNAHGQFTDAATFSTSTKTVSFRCSPMADRTGPSNDGSIEEPILTVGI